MLVVGAGHAGLVMSRLLAEAGREPVVVDRRDRPGGAWRDRWDSFRLVTPNWTASFPGMAYDGPDPDGFMTRDEITARVERYAEVVTAPVVLGGFSATTGRGPVTARQVVVATGSYHRPRLPAVAAGITERVVQLHAHDYRNESALPDGAVLVVGSGQTGLQLAEELFAAGRTVHVAVGGAGRVPRRYRGRDIFAWLAELTRCGAQLGVTLPTAEQLPDPRLRFSPMPALSGHGGGHDTNLRRYAADGMVLAGRLTGGEGEVLTFADDLARNLAAADDFFGDRLQGPIDAYIARAGIDAPADDRVAVTHEPPGLTRLDLARAGVTTIVWATGYDLDHRWIAAPVADERGYPRHTRGVAAVPGLFFVGLLWQHTQASASLIGPGLDGPHLVERMGAAARHT